MILINKNIIALVIIFLYAQSTQAISLDSAHAEQKTFLVFGGKTGWIGKMLVNSICEQGHNAVAAQSRLECREAIEQEITRVKPDFIINAAGVIGTPNVDWTEDHKQETMRSNIIGALNLVDIAYLHGIHITVIGTGCIYNYDAKHPMYSGIGFKEEEEPNFENAFYSKTKIMLEKLLTCYPNMLYLRVRLPIASDFYAKNLIIKLTKYQRVINIPNCITILDDLVPVVPQMALRGLTGFYNFVNPGVVEHNQMLEMYKEYIDPSFTYENFSLEEQSKVLKTGRCNNQLDVTKLLAEFPGIPEVKESLVKLFAKMKQKKEAV